MKKIASVLVAMAAAVAAAGMLTAAPSTAATAYPDCAPVQVTLTPSTTSMTGGNTLTVTSRATSGNNRPVGTLTVTAFGKTYRTGEGSITIKIPTPAVSKKTVYTITTQFVGSRGGGAAAQCTDAVSGSPSAVDAIRLTLLPKGTAPGQDVSPVGAVLPDSAEAASGDALPDTGGAPVGLLYLGGALMVAGGAAVLVSRRRTRSHG